MFEQAAVDTIYRTNLEVLDRILAMEEALSGRFYGLEKAVHCLSLAAMTGEVMLMIGPPGTAKSRLVRAFCSLIGVLDEDPRDAVGSDADSQGRSEQDPGQRYFEYLLTQFTEPSELFGYFDLAKLMGSDPRLARDEIGKMQHAEVVFLDEIFNASSAIQNALLTFINERKFHDLGRVRSTPLRMLFAASNHPPQEDGLDAIYDRFLLRCPVDNVPNGHEPLARLLDAAWTETHSRENAGHRQFADLPKAFESYRDAIDGMTTAGTLKIDQASPVVAGLASLVATVRTKELSLMSNRRLVKLTAVILAEALLRARKAGSDDIRIEQRDLRVILDYGLDHADAGAVEKLRQELLLA